MALLGNRSVLLKSPGRSLSAAHATYRSNYNTPGSSRGQYLSFSGLAAIPSGYRPPYCWTIAVKPGALSSHTIIRGDGSLGASLAGGKAAEATLAGSGDLSATGALVVSAAATLTGSGALAAEIVAYLNAAATLAGSGDLTGAIEALGWATATLPSEGTLTVVPRANGAMAASITLNDGAELDPATIAAAVWDTAEGQFLYAVAHNRVVTDPAAGTYTVYAADDVTVLYTAALWQDAAGTTPYAGAGADRRDRLE